MNLLTTWLPVFAGILISGSEAKPQPVCLQKGECRDGSIVGTSEAVSYDECLLKCQEKDHCKHFTHFEVAIVHTKSNYHPCLLNPIHQSYRLCVEYEDCPSVSSDACPHCLTGDRGCEPIGDRLCNFPGFCDGDLLGLQLAYSSYECHQLCVEQEECFFYNYQADQDICIFNMNCKRLEEQGAEQSFVGRRDCEPTAGT